MREPALNRIASIVAILGLDFSGTELRHLTT
jgi:hypothetical protein